MAESTPRGRRQPESARRLYSYHCWRRNVGRRSSMTRRWESPLRCSSVSVGLGLATYLGFVGWSTTLIWGSLSVVLPLVTGLPALPLPVGAVVLLGVAP